MKNRSKLRVLLLILVPFGYLWLVALAWAGSVLPDAGKNSAAKSPIVVPEVQPVWGGPLFGGGAKGNGEITEGNLFLVYPWLNSIGEGGTMGGSVGFVEPYVSVGQDDDFGAFIGLGFRHLFSEQSPADALRGDVASFFEEGIYIGGSAFLDYLQTTHDSDFWQVGFGAETGTRYVELRANYYLPISDYREIGSRTETTTEIMTDSRTATRLGTPMISGGRILQRVSRTTTTRDTTLTRTRSYRSIEEPLEGFDVELAVLMPFVDQYFDMQLVGGYYEYTGDQTSTGIPSGWRAGVEIRPVPAIVLHATWYDNDSLWEDDWLAGISFELPLGGDWKKAFTPRRRHLAERLYQPVRRKNHSITTNEAEMVTSSEMTMTSDVWMASSTGVNDLGAAPVSRPATPPPPVAPPPPPPPPPPPDPPEEGE